MQIHDTKNYHSILLTCLVNLGDVVIATSAAALLKRINPSFKITMMVRKYAEEIVKNNPAIDNYIIFEYKPKQKSLGLMLETVRKLKSYHFDLCFSLDYKLRSALLCYFAGIPTRVVPDKLFNDEKSRLIWLYTDVIRLRYPHASHLQVDNFQQAIRTFFKVSVSSNPLVGVPTAENCYKAEQMINGLPSGDKVVALCLQGTFVYKNWPQEYFAEVIKVLRKNHNARFYIVGTDGDSANAAKFISKYNECKNVVVNFCGKTSLMDLVALLHKTDLLLTVDTGTAHLAATTNIPIVCVYGCSRVKQWPPLSKKAHVLCTYEECAPCDVVAGGCPSEPKPKCLWNLKPAIVISACEKILNIRMR